MSAGVSILGQCAECCECPEATVEWDSRSASLTKVGFDEFTSPSTPPKKYLTATPSGSVSEHNYFYADCTGNICDSGFDLTVSVVYTVSGSSTYDYAGTLTPSSYAQTTNYCISSPTVSTGVFRLFVPNVASLPVVGNCSTSSHFLSQSLTQTVATWDGCTTCFSGKNHSGTVTQTLTDEYTTALLKSNTVAALPAYDNDWNDTAGSFADLSTDEQTYSIREARYRLRFKIPSIGFGNCYKVTWFERFVPQAGVAIDSIEVISGGNYRPIVTIETGGTTPAYAIAVMNPSGGVASIQIINPGSGYIFTPAVSVEAAILVYGGVRSTGWTATVTDGKVTAITGGSLGNYLPNVTISAPGGAGTIATLNTSMDTYGALSVAIATGGSGYNGASLTVPSKTPSFTPAVLQLHFGTETAHCDIWDGTTPSGYDPDDSATWPVLPSALPYYYELSVPSADGTTTVVNVVAECVDCSACP